MFGRQAALQSNLEHANSHAGQHTYVVAPESAALGVSCSSRIGGGMVGNRPRINANHSYNSGKATIHGGSPSPTRRVLVNQSRQLIQKLHLLKSHLLE